MGTTYAMNGEFGLPQTLALGIYDAHVYEVIVPTKHAMATLNVSATITSAVECAASVRQHYPDATGAECSNVDDDKSIECFAVMGADGIIFDRMKQTCLFSDVKTKG
eukprot:SAG11_NODE_10847_length_802_cov_0.941679_1_plen_107_part_00